LSHHSDRKGKGLLLIGIGCVRPATIVRFPLASLDLSRIQGTGG
jgi:hypothetical protein